MGTLRYIAVIRRYAWLVVLLTALGAGSSIVFTLRQHKIYQATTTLQINPAAPNSAVNFIQALVASGGYNPGGAIQRLADTYTAYITSSAFGKIVQTRLGLAIPPISQISTSLRGDTNFFDISVTDRDPVQAARIANGVAAIFIDQNNRQQQAQQGAPAQDAATQADDLLKEIRYLQGQEKRLRTGPSRNSPQTLSLLTSMDTTIGNLYAAYNNLQQNSQQESQSLNTASILVPAQAPVFPISPSLKKNVLFGTIAGLVIGLLVAFLLEYMDYSVRSPEDVETVAGQMPLAVISVAPRPRGAPARGASAPGRDAGVTSVSPAVFSLQNPRDAISEAFRALRTNLAFSALDRPVQTMVITSVSPSEGKSTVAANLAVVLAQSGKRVILVDADLRRPSLHKLFGLHNVGGFTDLLLTRDTTLTGLQSTVVPNLQVLASGPMPPNPAELLTSEAVVPLIAALKEQADIVIFDTPPMGALTDAVVLSARVEGTVLVVRSGSTRPTVVSKALETLRKVGARPLGVVLNMVDVGALRDYSYYYYYSTYGYGEYGSTTRKSADESTVAAGKA